MEELLRRRKVFQGGQGFRGLVGGQYIFFMMHFSIAELATKSIPRAWLLKSTLPDICIVWGDFFIGKALYDLNIRGENIDFNIGGCMLEKVKEVIEEIRPFLKADGGDVELIETTEDGIVKLRLLGACGHCPMSIMTLKMGIEKRLKERVPGVKEVVAI
jgi:Fe-S cluster biogenesis protein NfuA